MRIGTRTYPRVLVYRSLFRQALMRTVVQSVILLCCSIHGFSAPPPDITFTLKTTNAPAVYHLGERIVCKLSFSAKIPGKYNLIDFGEPRSGVVGQYQFSAIPADGAVDPRVDLGQLGIVTVGGQLFGCYKLSATPVIFETDPNEWLRFTKPGNYRLHARSSKVSLYDMACIPASADKMQVDSDSIDITILPVSKAWASEELKEIVDVLDSPGAHQDKTEAARCLRYLDTAAAASQMVEELPRSLDQPWHYDFYYGLLETSWRSTAISALAETIQNPRSRVSYDAVELLSMLVVLRQCGNKLLPNASRHSSAKFQAKVKHRSDRRTALLAKYTAELSASIPERTGRSRSDAIFALWKNAESHYFYKQPVPPNLYMLRQEIASVAEDLTPEQQAWLISIYWKGLPKEKLIPLLRSIASAPSPINTVLKRQDLRKQAQSRLCELQPTGCKQP